MSDIKRINGKFYDFGTKNSSFILTAKELKVLGIKNYYFMLRIDNPRVADIDPFNPRITAQEIDLLTQEFKDNMWSFIRMAVRLRTQKGVVEYGLHRGLAAALWCFEHHFDNCLCEPRQTYKTTGTLAGPLQWAFQLSENLRMHFFGKETKNTKKNLADLRDDISLLPEWLQYKKYIAEDGKIKKARQSTEKLENNLWHNELYIYPKPGNESHAQGLGRGGSGNILYFDEIEHMPFFGVVMGNSGPLFKTASENAADAGMPYCRLFSTTPGNLDTREGIESLPIIKSMVPWSERIYDMTPQEIEEYKSAYKDEYHSRDDVDDTLEVLDVFYIEYQYYQVRKTYQWVQEQYKIIGNRFIVRREILLQRLRGSNDSPIDPEDIEYLISNMVKSTKDIIINNKWRFLLYEHGQGYENGQLKYLDENIPYLVGIDPASGEGGDNFAITIINPFNLKIAAEFKSPYLGQTAAIQLLINLVEDYIPNAVLIIEKNNIGSYLIQTIVDVTPIKDNLYWSEKTANKQIEEMSEESYDDYKIKEMSQQYKKYGTYLTPKVRNALLEILFTLVAEHRELLNTEYLVNDICKLVRKNGKVQAVSGEHDDSLFSYLHCMYVYFTGDNLHSFGIIKTAESPEIGLTEGSYKFTSNRDNISLNMLADKPKTFNEYAMADAARLEEKIKTMVNTLPFVEDSVYHRNTTDDNDNNSIPLYFFDQINGITF